MYGKMWLYYQRGMITQEEWVNFCTEHLWTVTMRDPIARGVMTRLKYR